MLVKQLSVFVENKVGRLADLTQILAKEQIDIRALSVADTTDFGILRLIVSDPDRAMDALRENGWTVSLTEVLGVRVDDRPGALALVLRLLAENDMGVEYVYAFVAKNDTDAFVIMKVNDGQNGMSAISLLSQNGFSIIEGSKINMI